MNNSFKRFEGSEVAAQRMKIIRFYERYGEKATIEAFSTDRKVINRWKKRLKDMGGKLIALVPLSTRPKKVRKSTIPPEIIEFIRAIRQEYPRLGKEKIKPLLDRYCNQKGMKNISESTIGNIIKRHQLCFQKPNRIYHNCNSGWAKKIEKGERSLRSLTCKPV
jgi:transposase